MPTIYPPLAIGAKRRLELFKREATTGGWVRPMTWRDVRFANLTSHTGLAEGRNDDAPIWYANPCKGGYFPREKFADEVKGAHIDHTGWYAREDGSEKARGVVVALPHGRFLAGYYCNGNDERVYFPEIYDDEKDAASAADFHAEKFAEAEREYDERWNAKRQLEEEAENQTRGLREKLALRNRAGFEYARDAARGLIEGLRKTRETLRNDFSDIE